MPTIEQRDEFLAAHKELIALRDRHEAKLRALVLGEASHEPDALIAENKEIEDAHKRFMKASAPFVRWVP